MTDLLLQVWPPILGVFAAGVCCLVAGLALHRATRPLPVPTVPPAPPRRGQVTCPNCGQEIVLTSTGRPSRHLPRLTHMWDAFCPGGERVH